MLNERPIHPYNALYISSQTNRQIERAISAHCLGDHFHWLVSVSENKNTYCMVWRQLLGQWVL